MDRKKQRERDRQQLNERLPDGLELVYYGNGFPWQADAKLGDLDAYLRFRHNQGSMTVWEGKAWDSEVLLSSIVYPYFDPESERSCNAGTLDSPDEIVEFVHRVFAALEPYDRETNPTSAGLLRDQVAALLKAQAQGDSHGQTD